MAVAGGDWRDPACYDRLLPGDRRCFAWEWLRRTPAYRAAWRERVSPEPFGLERLEDPTHDALAARPIWSWRVDTAVLLAGRCPGRREDLLDLGRFAPLVSVVCRQDEPAHILLSDGLRSIRIDLDAAVSLATPLPTRWHIDGIHDVGPSLRALAQLSALSRLGRFARSLHPPERRAARWLMMLRVHDALATGASHRDAAVALFGMNAAQPRWRVEQASWRLRVQRLAAGARVALNAGPASWLRHDIATEFRDTFTS